MSATVNNLPRVQLPANGWLLSQFASELGKHLANTNIFVRDGLAFLVTDDGDGLIRMTPEKLRSWAEQHLSCYRTKTVEGGRSLMIKRTMTKGDAEGVLASPQFLGQLQLLERLHPVRMPIIRANGKLELLPEGYDKETRTFTVPGGKLEVMPMPPADAKGIIDRLLSEFTFADDGRSKAVVVAAMLTVYGPGLLPRKSLRPCFIVMANSEGAGKTLIVKSCTVPLLGIAPASCKPGDEQEMRKYLLSAIMDARTVIFLDNFKGKLESEALESFLTSQDWRDRILGTNRNFTGENNVTVFVTGNGCTVSADMRRRSLFAELLLESELPEDRVFREPLEVPLLVERRWEILNALWSLICHWATAGMPACSRSHSSFPAWAKVIGGIVEHAGYECPLVAPATVVDSDTHAMRMLIAKMAESFGEKEITFEELVKIASSNLLFDWLPEPTQMEAKSRAKFAALLKSYDRRLVGEQRFTILGEGRERRFRVEKVAKKS